MNAAWIAARAQMRRRRVATVALTLLVGLAGGVVLAAFAGASRTDSAMDRFVAFSRPEDVYVIVNGAQGDVPDPAGFARTLATRARLLALPQIAEAGRAPYVFMTRDKHTADFGSVNPFASADAHAFRTIDRPLVLRGRLARLDRPNEAVVDDLDAAELHVRVGSRVTLRSFSAQQTQAFATSGAGKLPSPEGHRYTFRVVGIVRDPTTVDTPPAAIVRDASYQGKGRMLLTPAFLRRFARDQGVPLEAVPAMEGFRIRLRHGLADLAGFERGVRRVVSPGDGQVHRGSDIQTAADKAQRPIHLEAIALALFGAITGLAALLILGQALARQVAADTDDYSTLAALGADRRQLVAVPLGRAIIIGFAGAVVAVVVALVLSPLTPIGLARRAEIHPGFSANWAVLALGFVSIAGVVLLRAFVAAWRAARTSQEHRRKGVPARPGPLNAVASGSGLGPPAVAGVAMAFERGRGVAFGTTLLGNLVAIAGVVAAVTFGVSLHHLVDTPREQGWNWDVIVGNPNSQSIAADPAADPLHQHMVHLLATNKYVGSFSGLAFQDGISVDGHQVDLAAVETDRGSVYQPIVEGRAPRSAHDIVLGRDALAQLHKGVGQTVSVRAGDHHTTMRIVGVSLQPTAGDMSPRLSRGGSVTLAALRPLAVQTSIVQFAVRYRQGVRRSAAFASMVDTFGRDVLRPYPGGEVGDLARVDYLPNALAGLLVVLAVGALALSLIGSVQRHRRDLAILKTIGFVGRQVSATVAWQATALECLALLVGVPVGLALGRWTWDLVAGSVGSESPAILTLGAVFIVIPAALLVANLLAAAPALVARSVRPAHALRNE